MYKNGKIDTSFVKIYHKVFGDLPETLKNDSKLCAYTGGSLSGVIMRLKAVYDISVFS